MTPDLRVGVITRPHGVRGELRVYPTTESPFRFRDFDRLRLKKAGCDQTLRELTLTGVKIVGGMAVLKIEGIESKDEAESLRGMELYIPREEGVQLNEGEYYIGDLIGMEVVTEAGERLGTIRDVLETGANDVYVVAREGMKDLLIPAIADCVLDVDIVDNIMRVSLMEGLLDL